MSNREDLLTPIGRLVQGSLYEPQTTDAENKPLTYKSGPNQNEPRVNFYFALAIEKKGETHWSQTPWGAKVWKIGHEGFKDGQAQSRAFAWKIVDGDSVEPNRVGRKPCDREGYPGHWVLNFSSGFAPGVYNDNGTQQLLEPDFVKLGDYIQVFGGVASNDSMQQPGIYLNHQMVAFCGYGKRIILGADPKSVGFGQTSDAPAGMSKMPVNSGFNPAPTAYVPPQPVAPNPSPYTPPVSAPTPPPYPEILNPQKIMTDKAQGSYDEYIKAGWTDVQLIQHGFMSP